MANLSEKEPLNSTRRYQNQPTNTNYVGQSFEELLVMTIKIGYWKNDWINV